LAALTLARKSSRRTFDCMRSRKLGRALGIFSIGLGAAELLAPGAIGRFLGSRRHSLLRGFGARELAAGIGLLASRRLAPWLWARVGGDVLDLAALGFAIARGRRRNALIATGAVAGVTALDVLCAGAVTRDERLFA
jgi:hypothetical protein